MTQHEKDLQAIAEYRMSDDTFMSAVFDGQIEETELLLRTVLGREDITVLSSESQFYLSNIYGKEVKLDILAKDNRDKAYHVEVQRDLSRAPVQRARFDAAMVDITLLKKGQDYTNLPDRYTIFITEQDKFHRGCPVYHAENIIRELNEPLGDGGYIIYVNGEYRNTDTPIGRLMHDFFCTNADDMLDPLLRERVRYLKETEGGREHMCQIMENRITEEKIELAKKAIARGKHTLEDIAEDFELPLPIVRELARKQGA